MSNRFHMKALTTAVAIAGIGFTFLSATVLADHSSPSEKQKRAYVGFGLGVAQVDPETEGTSWTVEDDIDLGAKIFVGHHFHQRFAGEFFFDYLGEADLVAGSTEGTVDYKEAGLAGLWYFLPKEGVNYTFKGFSPFIKLGASSLTNKAEVVNYDRVNSVQGMFGLGFDFGFTEKTGVRLEIEQFSNDASFLSASIMRRFGHSMEKKMVMAPEPAPLPVYTPEPEPEPLPPVVKAVVVPPPPPEPVVEMKKAECENIDAVASMVNFKSGSDSLVPQARAELETFAQQLIQYPSLEVQVEAHTDSLGSANFNMDLSEKRANSVREYLLTQGVDPAQVYSVGFGEDSPIADNATVDGRKMNRRVVFTMLNSVVCK